MVRDHVALLPDSGFTTEAGIQEPAPVFSPGVTPESEIHASTVIIGDNDRSCMERAFQIAD
jgi:hypothetical protein